VAFLGAPPENIDVVYQGCHPLFHQTASSERRDDVLRRYDLPRDYILYVGTIEERKNALHIVKALQAAGSDVDLPVVLIGRMTAYGRRTAEFARRAGLENRVRFLHDVPFADLPALYQAARLFVYPSIFEGFGIPIVEALASGVPVITSTGSCFAEAGGPGSIYVSPRDPEELAAAMRRVLSDSDSAARMVREGYAHIRQFEPHAVAERMMDVYRRALGEDSVSA
jgi:glycosyltransferase involved in cell wall biosynthesis